LVSELGVTTADGSAMIAFRGHMLAAITSATTTAAAPIAMPTGFSIATLDLDGRHQQ
jgi:hypothetical protein